jgi:ABC-type multidrug transport system fused ATPase/permease subunit
MKFTSDEQISKTTGAILTLYRFIKSVPYLRTIIFLSIPLLTIGFVAGQLFIRITAELANGNHSPIINSYKIKVNVYYLITVWLLAISTLFIAWFLVEVIGQYLAYKVHRTMISAVGSTRTTFFDEYPSGKLINRIIRDFDLLRKMAPIRIGDTIGATIDVLVGITIIAIAAPLLAVLSVPLIIWVVYIQFNLNPLLQKSLILKSIEFGKVLHRETDIIEGIITFKLYNGVKLLLSKLKVAFTNYAKMHIYRLLFEGWGRFWMEFGIALFTLTILITLSYSVRSDTISVVFTTVVITALLRLNGSFAWLAWASGYLMESSAHAKRIWEFIDLPTEESEEGITLPKISNKIKLSGALTVTNYTMSYRRDTPIILNNISFTIPIGHKVGIIGRTGAGKSSLIQALFRMVYVHSGDITIGDTSIYSLPIKDSREIFTIIPQDPYIFSGTVSTNLDRSNQYHSYQLQKVLAKVHFKYPLEMLLVEGGKNLSVGEKQLLCLARILLTNKQFIIMDEPTSSIDSITDTIIQQVITDTFKDKTLIIIAHRLETLAGVDQIIEL